MITGHGSWQITVSQLLSGRHPESKTVTCVRYLHICRPAHSGKLLLAELPAVSVTLSPPPALFRCHLTAVGRACRNVADPTVMTISRQALGARNRRGRGRA